MEGERFTQPEEEATQEISEEERLLQAARKQLQELYGLPETATDDELYDAFDAAYEEALRKDPNVDIHPDNDPHSLLRSETSAFIRKITRARRQAQKNPQ